MESLFIGVHRSLASRSATRGVMMTVVYVGICYYTIWVSHSPVNRQIWVRHIKKPHFLCVKNPFFMCRKLIKNVSFNTLTMGQMKWYKHITLPFYVSKPIPYNPLKMWSNVFIMCRTKLKNVSSKCISRHKE